MALRGLTYIAPGIPAKPAAPVAVRPVGCFCCAPFGFEEEDGEAVEPGLGEDEEAYRELYGDNADVEMAGPGQDAAVTGDRSVSSEEGGMGRKRRHEAVAEDGDAVDSVVIKRRRTVGVGLAATSVVRADLPSLQVPPLLSTSPIAPLIPAASFLFDPLKKLRAYDPCLLPPLVINALRKPTAYLAGPGDPVPSLAPHLSISDFFPDNGDLVFIPDVYFLERPVEPAWSVDYYRSFARFLQACGSSDESLVFECSLAAFGCLRPGSEPLLEQSRHILSRQPDKRVVYQNAAIAVPLDGFEQLPKVLQKWVLTMRKVLIWAMAWPGELSTGQVLRFIKEARPAAHLIIREFADVLRIRHLIHRLERQIIASPPLRPSPAEQAARTILGWLNETNDEQRKFGFFCQADGKVREAKDGWEKWVARMAKGETVTRKELDAVAGWAEGVKKR
ncbi:Proteophosphoglycan ppg4 [Rhodotorula toruloides ATCC 204091]|uniref:Proteophosphoglycan ppg4 n=1 Tax=Rhodotorula toruloides TaxID=5286 RepID=A0A0K3CJA3_RHOTO|nr:Proteophosphoglycan ppg4 [Rhodotorula toruloides ATCC 204091]PRQ71689.1 Proteophosphoglycan ppg4 [Rhodotorula toruloides]